MSNRQKPLPQSDVKSDNNTASDRKLMRTILDDRNACYSKWSTLTGAITVAFAIVGVVARTRGYLFGYNLMFFVFTINFFVFLGFNGLQISVRSMVLRLDESPREFIKAFSYNADKKPSATLFRPRLINKLPTPAENLESYLTQRVKFTAISYVCAFVVVVMSKVADSFLG